MSDISFLLLTFFLLTSSIDTDLGISRRLPPPLPPNAPKPEIHERDVMKVLISFNDDLRVQGQNMDITQLRSEVADFLANPSNDPKKSDKSMKEIDGLGTYPVSKGVISLQNDRGTSYEMYVRVQDELSAAIHDLRDDLSRSKFGVKFDDLRDEDQKEAIQKAIPMSISEAEPRNNLKTAGGN